MFFEKRKIISTFYPEFSHVNHINYPIYTSEYITVIGLKVQLITTHDAWRYCFDEVL